MMSTPAAANSARDLDRLLRRHAVVADPVGGRNAHGHRLVAPARPRARAEHLERIAHAVFERAAVFVGATVGQRRDEAPTADSRARICSSTMSKPARSPRIGAAATNCVAHEVHVRRASSARGIWLRGDQGDGRGGHQRPVAARAAARPSPPSRAGSSPWRRNGRAAWRSSPAFRRGRNRRCASRPPRARAHRGRGSPA